jgi:hypothetical protein
MSNNINFYKDQVLKHLHQCGANSALAASLINVHGEFIESAMDRGRPAERLAGIIFNTHQLQTVKK